MRRRLWLAAVAGMMLVSCSSGGDASTTITATSPAPRPSSTAKLSITSPKVGQVVHGPVKLVVDLQDAKIVPATSQDLQPNEGHLHVLLDGQLITMTAQLQQTIPDVTPGLHVLQVEFVANDHAPFDPRVIAKTAFTEAG